MGSETNRLDARVVRDEPGATEIHVENRHVLRDGPMLVECWFSEEDGAYIARLTDDEPEGRPFTATHTGIGATREEALAHLAVAEYVLALAVATPTPAADGEADFAKADSWARMFVGDTEPDTDSVDASVGNLCRAYLALRARPALPADDEPTLAKANAWADDVRLSLESRTHKPWSREGHLIVEIQAQLRDARAALGLRPAEPLRAVLMKDRLPAEVQRVVEGWVRDSLFETTPKALAELRDAFGLGYREDESETDLATRVGDTLLAHIQRTEG